MKSNIEHSSEGIDGAPQRNEGSMQALYGWSVLNPSMEFKVSISEGKRRFYMGDFIMNNFGWVIVVLIGFCFFALASISHKQQEQRAAFMAACIQDKKQYECDVLWGQTAESKASAQAAQNMAIGMAAGAIAGRR